MPVNGLVFSKMPKITKSQPNNWNPPNITWNPALPSPARSAISEEKGDEEKGASDDGEDGDDGDDGDASDDGEADDCPRCSDPLVQL